LNVYIDSNELVKAMFSSNVGIDMEIKMFDAKTNKFIQYVKFSEIAGKIFN
jgi:hypothetical protein